jgi:VIT1/CCC1 family predicted Fe2+/Mn2+ transporter
MVGIHSGTRSRIAVIGAILTIAIADAFSDALGIHISEESENKHTTREIWESTISTFLSKLIFAMTFIVPVLFLKLDLAIIISILWGLFSLSLFSYYLAKEQNVNVWKVILEHLFIAIVVIAATYSVGMWIRSIFI